MNKARCIANFLTRIPGGGFIREKVERLSYEIKRSKQAQEISSPTIRSSKNPQVVRLVESKKEVETLLAKINQDEQDLSFIRRAKKLVIFFEIEPYRMCGGQMSLFSYCSFSKKSVDSETAVVMCTLPGEYTYFHNNNFENNENILRWEQVRNLLNGKEEVLLHIPEVDILVPETKEQLFKSRLKLEDALALSKLKNLHINIVDQQIELMPPREVFEWLFELTDKVTFTICNKASATQEICDKFQIPMHFLSVYYPLGSVKPIKLNKKKNLILLSPDAVCGEKFKVNFIKKLNEKLPNYDLFIIRDVKFSDYIKLTAQAKAVLTFGEGFDGYFNNSPLVGTLAFSVFNREFFPSDSWKGKENVFASYKELKKEFLERFTRIISNESHYDEIVEMHRKEILQLYDLGEYEDNLRRFYEKKYDFYPNKER